MANANPTAALIRERLAGGKRLPWEEVMRLALYEPGLGYYRQGTPTIGRSGDFFTSVSVGPVFGELLSLFCAQTWRQLGSPTDFAIIEQGAHDGRLALDLLHGLRKHTPALANLVRYLTVEPDETLRSAQRVMLKDWAGQVEHVVIWEEASSVPSHAVFLCNELLDAFPVHRVQFDAATCQWREMFVEDSADVLTFTTEDPSSEELRAELSRLPTEAPDGCITEINLGMIHWLRALARSPFRGVVLILDYGYTMDEWLSSGNLKGSLYRYRNHQSDDRILEDLGECDLTSHVNFTRLAQEAESLDLPVLEFVEQGRFLTHNAAAALKTGPAPGASWLRQFQTLTHPGMMGRSFHALVLGKGSASASISTPERQEAARRRLGIHESFAERMNSEKFNPP